MYYILSVSVPIINGNITVNVDFNELGFLSGPYSVKNQIKHKRKFQNTYRFKKRTTQKSIVIGYGIRLKKKPQILSIRLIQIPITKNFTCKF
jgi:hypothetical protein